MYAVSKYLDDHPGGPVVISNRGGKDASKPFEDAGHSENAQKKMSEFAIGVIKEGSQPLPGQVDGQGSINVQQVAILVLGLIIAFAIYFITNKTA